MAGNATSFRPGQSGNPGGRPKWLKEVQRLAESKCPEAIEDLYQIAKNAHGDVKYVERITAWKEILDRGLGKAKQQTEITTGGNLDELSLDELRTILAVAERAAAGFGGDAAGGDRSAFAGKPH